MGFLERAPHRAAAGADTYVALIVAAPATKDFRESRRRHRRFFLGERFGQQVADIGGSSATCSSRTMGVMKTGDSHENTRVMHSS